MDPSRSLEIMRLLERINALGTTVLVVTHEKDLVNRFDKRVKDHVVVYVLVFNEPEILENDPHRPAHVGDLPLLDVAEGSGQPL